MIRSLTSSLSLTTTTVKSCSMSSKRTVTILLMKTSIKKSRLVSSEVSWDYCTKLPTHVYTVEPPIKDPLGKGQPLYKGHLLCPKVVFPIVLIHSNLQERTTFLQRTELLLSKCPLFGGSTVCDVSTKLLMCMYIQWFIAVLYVICRDIG